MPTASTAVRFPEPEVCVCPNGRMIVSTQSALAMDVANCCLVMKSAFVESAADAPLFKVHAGTVFYFEASWLEPTTP